MDTLYSASVLGSTVYQICWSFFIYSFLGVLVEGIFCLAMAGVLEVRVGLLYLPLRPIYGIGGAASALVLDRFLDQPIWAFLLGMMICTAVEYVASFVIENAFGSISWDYRDKPLNLHGRICLQYSLGWGMLAILVVYVIQPFLNRFLQPAGHRSGEIVLTALLIVTILSSVLTLAAWARIRQRVTTRQKSAAGGSPGPPRHH
jgi:uncharacterized membrane protein